MRTSVLAAPPVHKAGPEMRREPRLPARGSVTVCLNRDHYTEINGQLLDVSASGFRMSHTDKRLEPGQIVDFCHTEASGTARVIWNRIVNHRVQTGFLIVKLS